MQPLLALEGAHGKRLLCEDATSEALALLLSKNGECLASFSPDARDVIENLLGKYRENGKTDEGLLLKAFSWEPHVVDRIGRSGFRLKEPCLSILWLVQPDKIELLFAKESLLDGGLLPRFLVCQTHCVPQKIDRTRAGVEQAVLDALGAVDILDRR